MKVLQINGSDHNGGAAIALQRLHRGLLRQDIDSRLLVGNSQDNDPRLATIPKQPKISRLIAALTWRLGLNYLDSVNSFKLNQHHFYQSADILNFHNLHGGYFNYLAIPQLAKAKPAIWTLHDMWSFTGHCIYSYDCDRWKTGCGKCPYPQTYPQVQRDSTRWEWQLKNWIYQRSNLVIVTLSRWLTKQVEQSMLSHLPIHHIPNGIDTEAYKPLDQRLCRSVLDIPTNKKVLMFGAQSLGDRRKGGDLLIEALTALPAACKQDTVLLTMGNCGVNISDQTGIQTINLGYVSSDRLKSVAYSAADLFVFPTRADNLPLVLQESMACGTPMVSLNVGGVPDLVRPGITGHLAEPEDIQGLSQGIAQLLQNKNLRQQMSHNCRAIAVQEYSLELQAQRYIALYQQVLANNSKLISN